MKMGLPTQELEKDGNGEPTSRKENDGGNAKDYSHGSRGEPVAYLRVNKWSVTSESMVGSELPTVYPIFSGTNFIGRSAGSSILFPYLVVSGRHACIDVKETLHTVRDCVSTNETKRNGITLESEVRYEIVDNTELSFADVECSYYIGRLPTTSELAEQKVEARLKRKHAPLLEQDSLQSSTASSTSAVTTIFQNFLMDDDSEDILEMGSGNVQATDTSAAKTSPPAVKRKNPMAAAPCLTVLVEESQLMNDERLASFSLFSDESRNVPQVVRETEQFLVDDNNTGPETEKAGDGDDGEHGAGDSFGPLQLHSEENEIETKDSQKGALLVSAEAVDVTSSKGLNSDVPDKAMTADGAECSADDRTSIEEAIRPNMKTPGSALNDAASAETLPYLSGLPVPLGSLRVKNRSNSLLVTKASSTTETTRSSTESTGAPGGGPNRTSIWSGPTSEQASNRTAKKRSLLDVAADGWLFNSEPGTRRKKVRSGGNRRKTTIERSKGRFEELTEKCKKAIAAAKRISKEKRALKDDSKEDIVRLASEAAAKVSDPFDFGPSQYTEDSMGESFVTSLAGTSAKKAESTEKPAPKARKSVKSTKCFETTAASEAVGLISLTTASPTAIAKRKRVNDEAKFDEAAERSRQQHRESSSCKGSTHKGKLEDECMGDPRSCRSADKVSSESRAEQDMPMAKKSKSGTDAASITSEESSSDATTLSAAAGAATLEMRDQMALEREERNIAGMQTPDRPKATSKAPGKRKVTTNQQRDRKAKTFKQESSDELSDVILPQKPKAKKAASGRGQPKAAKEVAKSSGGKSASRAVVKRLDDEEAAGDVKVCFTQMVGISKTKLEQLKQDVRELKGEVVDSGVDCTHLVIPKFARSAKLMCAIARGAPIVVPEWVEESKQAGRFLDADKFLIKDKPEEKRLGFSLRECISSACDCIAKENKLLFDGYAFYSTESVRPNREEMKSIVTSAGGRFLERLSKTAPKGTTFVALSCEADEESTDIKRLKAMEVPIVSMEFVLTGLLKREVNVQKYELFRNEAPIVEIPKGRKKVQEESGSSSQASSTPE